MSYSIESGNSRKCECGRIYYDSDGGCDCVDEEPAENNRVDEQLADMEDAERYE